MVKGIKSRKRKAGAKIESITIYCQNLNRSVVVEAEKANFSGSSSECELCGSHGSVKVYVRECQCGSYHDIELYEW